MTTAQGNFRVSYEIRTGIDGSVVHTGETTVLALDADTARDNAVTWAHENDPYADPRLDPTVHVTDVSEADDAAS